LISKKCANHFAHHRPSLQRVGDKFMTSLKCEIEAKVQGKKIFHQFEKSIDAVRTLLNI
jgi:hypothetical protein